MNIRTKDLIVVITIWFFLVLIVGGGCGSYVFYLGLTEMKHTYSGRSYRTYDIDAMRNMKEREAIIRFSIGFAIGGVLATLFVRKSYLGFKKTYRKQKNNEGNI